MESRFHRPFSSHAWKVNYEVESIDQMRKTLMSHHFTLFSVSNCVFLQLIKRIRESATLVISLPPDLQRIARDSYSASLKWVFLFGACSSLLAYLVRLPVRRPFIILWHPIHVAFPFDKNSQIPDKVLERRPREAVRDDESSSSVSHSQRSDVESEHCIIHDDNHNGTNGNSKPRPRRDDGDAVMDPEHGGTRSTPRCNC